MRWREKQEGLSLKILFIYLFWLCRVFVAARRLSVPATRGFCCCREWTLGSLASAFVAKGLVAPWYGGSSSTRDRTGVLCIGREILNH